MASTIFKTKFTKNKKLATFRMVLTPSENIKNKEQTKLTKAIKRKTFSKDLFFKVVTPFLNIIIKGYHNQFKNRKLIPQSSAITEKRPTKSLLLELLKFLVFSDRLQHVQSL